MIKALFTSDLHCKRHKYKFLFEKIKSEQPDVVFIAGDLTSLSCNHPQNFPDNDFYKDYLGRNLSILKSDMGEKYPAIYVIPGNDDGKNAVSSLLELEKDNLLRNVNERFITFKNYTVFGYSYVPPTPFMNKDWEKYDVSAFVDVGCVSPEEGYRSEKPDIHNLRYYTIKKDLEILFENKDTDSLVCLFHSPPYQSNLDRADLEGKFYDGVPLDVHVGSIAIKEFIQERNPYLTLHGHIHESTSLTGKWMENINSTYCMQGASLMNEASLIKFDLENPESAEILKIPKMNDSGYK